MLRLFGIHVLLAIFLIHGSSSQTCPQWVESMLEAALANSTTWPGIQLTLSSPYCGLDCTTSVQSKADRFADEPALLDDTPWRIASITKTFTAVAILKLVERGQLDLYAPAVQYLPDWAVELLEQSQGVINASQITTWQLLHHTSGLGDFASDPRWMQEVLNSPQHVWTQRSLFEWSTANSTSVGYPGEVFHYSDTGYTLLGLILEVVTKTDLAAAVRRLTGLDDLGMLSTWWELLEPQPKDSSQRAGQYYNTIDVTHYNPTFDLYAAGGLVSDSKDLNRFGRALFEGRLLDEKVMQLMYSLEPSRFYGCGIANYSFAGQQAWGHTGFWHSCLFWVPSLDLAISGTGNQAAGNPFDIDKLVQNVIDHGCNPMEVARQGLDSNGGEKVPIDFMRSTMPVSQLIVD
ncbi:hypothetical protein LTS08_007698 [Lithohypha guttulata]|nr:hypothetical protein LTS08_007698 [Lithohypha guttulata]